MIKIVATQMRYMKDNEEFILNSYNGLSEGQKKLLRGYLLENDIEIYSVLSDVLASHLLEKTIN